MAESLTVTALRNKRDDIERAIASYQKKIEAARSDLAHINATIRLFETGQTKEGATHVDTLRLFKRGEISKLCKDALKERGPLDTRQLAVVLIEHRGLDTEDAVLRKSLTFRVVQALRLQAKRGSIKTLGKRSGVLIWMCT